MTSPGDFIVNFKNIENSNVVIYYPFLTCNCPVDIVTLPQNSFCH